MHTKLTSICWKLLLAGVATTIWAGAADAETWFVDGGVEQSAGGDEWSTAFKYLQEALPPLNPGLSEDDQIWVAEGTYKPDQDDSHPSGTGNRSATFNVVHRVTIYGGFPAEGGEDGTFAARDPDVYITTLSGDIGAAGDTSDNSLHVVTAEGSGSIGVLDGFRIVEGNADFGRGGGMLVDNAYPHIVRCTFEHNRATRGGAVGFAGQGGRPLFVNCYFLSNIAVQDGGAIHCSLTKPTGCDNCVFYDNTAQSGSGGAIYVECDFESATVRLRNCTFHQNMAPSGGAIGWDSFNCASSDIANCIFWGDSPDEIYAPELPPEISYSDVQGGWPGDGNINVPPLFVDSGGGNLRLDEFSPCIDAASTDLLPDDVADIDGNGDTGEQLPLDLDMNRRVRAGTVDMGAYEFFCVGDLNDDGLTNIQDFLFMLGRWGPCPDPPDPCPADIDGDGDVDIQDFLIFLGDFGCNDPDYEGFPESAQACIDKYWPDVEEVAACITALELKEQQ
jgi:predicted outer membrane repeat protein